MELFFLWAISLFSLSSLDDKEIDSVGAALGALTKDIASFLKPILFIGMIGMTWWGFYVWFNGFMGVPFTGIYRFMLGSIIFPMVPFWFLQILRAYSWGRRTLRRQVG